MVPGGSGSLLRDCTGDFDRFQADYVVENRYGRSQRMLEMVVAGDEVQFEGSVGITRSEVISRYGENYQKQWPMLPKLLRARRIDRSESSA